MGLDMYLNAKLKDVSAVDTSLTDSYLAYLEWKQAHPEGDMTWEQWYGEEDSKIPSEELIQIAKKHGGRINREIGYWRKANQIHKWFEDHVAEGDLENCVSYPVSREQLCELLTVCQTVLNRSQIEDGMVQNGQKLVDGEWVPCMEEGKIMTNSEVAEELLPTERGFFFGSTDYDQWYIEDLKNTIKIINRALEEIDFDAEEVSYCAWW